MNTSENVGTKKSGKLGKILSWIVVILLIGVSGYVYYKYYFVFGEGVKSGYLNYAVKKGNLFKTYEGKLIQEGFGNSKKGPGISSNEFEFSVENDSIFRLLELNSGKYFDLHYKEYHGVLPWRGNTRYIVDQVIHMQ
ncbi:hypothetical protein BC792_11018 [Sphingobacterium allocomposti]|jgi:hypothetical protein|uniref:6-phosphogluconate dehydrogenase n=1 Tax=Sphingobacterium allocomposti TaxID=415956 RepID=A0A5S5DIC6_9SPHI|nr:hypothetical protein [Sphingobacterium composti Yoo et al. 2007 non Ten et al. 2007]TYP95691.1 hypothetical protein BC792_11018 [Sphingobacterium composti Yoo et al. 2007 non Ten et al. 2007]HLS96582.1 hypothetical protein [Sphingobacterium sp.]